MPTFTFSAARPAKQCRQVTYGETFTVQPFGNSLVTMTLTGAQIDDSSSSSGS